MVSLTLVIVGAITTLVCAPKAGAGKLAADDDGDADSPPPGDDAAPAAEADQAPVEDPESEFEVDQDELDTVAAGSLETTGLSGTDGDAGVDSETSEFAQSVEELGTVVAGSLDELKSKLEDSKIAGDEDGLDTVAADPIEEQDPPADEETDDDEQADS